MLILFLAIISIPKQHAILISAIKTCLLHIESIIESHSTISRQMTGESKQVPPPLPPKPTKIQKPLVPPKPARVSRPSSAIIKEEIGKGIIIIIIINVMYKLTIQ